MQLKKAKLLIDVTVEGIATSLKDTQLLKTLNSIEVIFGNSIWDNDEQSLNAWFPTLIQDDGREICFIEEHLLKVHSSIEVTENGIAICSKDEHSLNAYLSIEVNEDGIVSCFKDEQ